MVLYLGLFRALEPDGRIITISEFIENGRRFLSVISTSSLTLFSGNLRQYIHDKPKPLPWRLRLSFATNIARVLAYLHACKCIHCDLKGENILVIAKGRLEITDFGFSPQQGRVPSSHLRCIVAYMSPEILLAHEFGLSTDIFSLGVILAEIAARHLANDTHFARSAPSFAMDAEEAQACEHGLSP